VDVPARVVWDALLLRMGSSRAGARQVARVLGCRETRQAGDIGQPGSTIVGFRVARAEPPRRLALEGRHHFSSYALTFTIDELGGGRSRLCASTDAAFPGVTGRVYKTLVIGSRGHVLAVRSLLNGVRSAALAHGSAAVRS
jgi:hypothetical protein